MKSTWNLRDRKRGKGETTLNNWILSILFVAYRSQNAATSHRVNHRCVWSFRATVACALVMSVCTLIPGVNQ